MQAPAGGGILSLQHEYHVRCYHMCHHTRDGAREQWDLIEPAEEDEEADDDPSFVQDERDVDVELLEADDD